MDAIDVIINDHSICGQFASISDFEDNLVTDILPLMKHFKHAGCLIYKSYNTFDRLITTEHKLSDLLKMRGSPELQRAKSAINNLIYEEPFWCKDDKIDDLKDNNKASLFCILETLERKGILLSFRHPEFSLETIKLKIYDIDEDIRNCFSETSGLNHLYDLSIINESYFYTHIKIGIKVDFLVNDDRNYPQEIFDNSNLICDDKQRLKDKLLKLLSCILSKTAFGELSKNFGDGLWEFRCDISNTRTLRIFYVFNTKGVTFLNGFVKKSQKTPKTEIEKARKLAKLTT